MRFGLNRVKAEKEGDTWWHLSWVQSKLHRCQNPQQLLVPPTCWMLPPYCRVYISVKASGSVDLSRISFKSFASARTAIHSLATAISNPVSLEKPFSVEDWPTVTVLKKRSLTSSTRFLETCQKRYLGRYHVILSGLISSRANRVISSSVNSFGSVLLMPNFFNRFNIEGANSRFPFVTGTRRLYNALSFWVASWNILVSIAAANICKLKANFHAIPNKLFAAAIAWMSPVRCKLNSSIGITFCVVNKSTKMEIPDYNPHQPLRLWFQRWALDLVVVHKRKLVSRYGQ